MTFSLVAAVVQFVKDPHRSSVFTCQHDILWYSNSNRSQDDKQDNNIYDLITSVWQS